MCRWNKTGRRSMKTGSNVRETLGKRPDRMHIGGEQYFIERRALEPVGAAFGERFTPMRDPDEDLVRRIGAGDKRAAAELVRRHLPKMVGLGRRMLGNHAEAEDVGQE